jgi:hypothetical protein
LSPKWFLSFNFGNQNALYCSLTPQHIRTTSLTNLTRLPENIFLTGINHEDSHYVIFSDFHLTSFLLLSYIFL